MIRIRSQEEIMRRCRDEGKPVWVNMYKGQGQYLALPALCRRTSYVSREQAERASNFTGIHQLAAYRIKVIWK